MKFQALSVTPKVGTIKGTNRPYSMLIVDGIYTDDQGVMKTCEHAIFVEAGRPTPNIVAGQTYEPIIKVGVTRDKKLAAFIEDFRPYVEKPVRAAA